MNAARFALSHALAILLLLPPIARAQYPLVPQATYPLLYVRVSGPAGMRVTFYRGGAMQSLATPFVVGLRPGYVYRIALSGVPGQSDRTFYPSLEVRGSVSMPPRLNAADFPVPVVFSQEDFRSAAGGALITRILLLERPAEAIPEATRADQPIELSAASDREAEAMSHERGRPLLVVRLGQRQWSSEELTAQGIPGTVLCPGERTLGPARDLPWLPCTCMPVEATPVSSAEEICIPDGGDAGLPAGLDSQRRLRGLDPGDTVAQYADSAGRPHLAVSNRVCICVPRYVAIRTEIAPAVQLALVPAFSTRVANGYGLLLGKVPPLEEQQIEAPLAFAGRERPSASLLVTGPVVVGRVQGADVVSSEEGTGRVTGACVKTVIAPERPLIIIKWPDKSGGQIGDVVTFFLRYSNQGGRPISDIIVSDSLAPRFEYVPNSARADRDAVFTIRPNEAGSSILRWEVAGELPPGKSGTVSFQVRIR